jgi:ABC-type antimicrobial peptide transport system permease subunit
MEYGRTPDQVVNFYKEAIRRIKALPGVDNVALGTLVPWREGKEFGPGFQFSADGHVRAPGEEDPRAQLRTISPGFFASLGVPILEGRDFNDIDRRGGEPVVIVSRTLAERLFPNQDPIGRHVMWTDPVMKFAGISTAPRRIVGVSADVDDQNITPQRVQTIYHSFSQEEIWGGRMFVHSHGDPYALVSPTTGIIRALSPEQPVERAATLEDVRAEVLTPDRLNTIVFGGFAAVALAIAIVGVAGVLAFMVSGRTREFGIRLAIGSKPVDLLKGVILDGAVIAVSGIAVGLVLGYLLARLAGSYFDAVQIPGLLPLAASALVLLAAAITASVVPASRAARVDVMQALRSE